jgi:hypothetical protein
MYFEKSSKIYSRKVSSTTSSANITKIKIKKLRVKDELKVLYTKKQRSKEILYKTHLEVANEWKNTWYLIEQGINERQDNEMKRKYNIIDRKVNDLSITQAK